MSVVPVVEVAEKNPRRGFFCHLGSTYTLFGRTDIPVCHNIKDKMKNSKDKHFKITRRKLPHWFLEGSTYFVTFRLASGKLSRNEIELLFDHIKSGDDRFYTLFATVVMPDHTHLLIQPNEGVELSRIMKGIKGASARKINKLRGIRGRFWVGESFDRIVRDQDEFFERLNYMLFNSFRAGLIEDPWEYKGWYWKGW